MTTTQAKHTRGPWIVSDCGAILTSKDSIIATVHSGDRSNPILRDAVGAAEADRNAHLIASAPELLEALKLAEKTLSINSTWVSNDNQEAFLKVSRAIAKAEGREP